MMDASTVIINTTVVIPNFNGIKYIGPCIDSLLASMDNEFLFDIIVVDNGSTDGSMELVKNNYPMVRLIELGENTGFAYAVNRGIEEANTKYVLLLNNDIVVDDCMVRFLEDAIEKEEKAFSVNAMMLSMANPELVDGAGDYYCALGWAYAYGKDKAAEKIVCQGIGRRKLFSCCAGAAIYRKLVFDEIGMFDEEHFAYLEDVDIGYRARIAGYRNLFEPTAMCEHAGSGSSGSRYNEFKIKLSSRNSTYLIRKNMPLLQRIINLPFFIIGFGIKLLFFSLKGFGGLYLRGLFEGIKLSFSEKGRSHKVKFHLKHLGNYCRIQLELWINIFRRILA